MKRHGGTGMGSATPRRLRRGLPALAAAATLICIPGAAEGGDIAGPALHEAVLGRDAAETARLLEDGAPTAYTGQGEMTALHLAAARGWAEGAALLLRQGAEPNARDRYGWSPLHLAANGGHRDAASRLIEGGADVHAADTGGGLTPLHRAAHGGHAETVELLLRHGADADARGTGGHGWEWAADMTPLHWAAAGHGESNARAIALLLEAGADVSFADAKGKTALHWAALANRPAAVAALLRAGASPEAMDDRRETPADLARYAVGLPGVETVYRLLTGETP